MDDPDINPIEFEKFVKLFQDHEKIIVLHIDNTNTPQLMKIKQKLRKVVQIVKARNVRFL
jgi:ribosomal protein L10